jgi:hypothetical protein
MFCQLKIAGWTLGRIKKSRRATKSAFLAVDAPNLSSQITCRGGAKILMVNGVGE